MILFIDEEPRWVGTYVEALRDAGHEVTASTNVDEGLAILKTRMAIVELVVLDVMMPPGHAFKDEDTVLGTKTGQFFYERIREMAPQLPVVILTNITEPGVSNFFQDQEYCWFLHKEDYDPFAFAEKMQKILNNFRKTDSF